MEEKKNKKADALFPELDKLSFEEALEKLEEIVNEMECGNIPLEKMISSFEKSSVLASACQSKLDALRTKIEILRKDRQSGNYKWSPLNDPLKAEDANSKEAENTENTEDVPF